MRIIKISLVSIAVVGLSACSTISDRYGFLKDETQSYKRAAPVEGAVVIPQNLSSKNVEDYYEVPEAGAEAPNGPPSLLPPGSGLAPNKAVLAPAMSQQDRIRYAENAKILGHTNPTANGPKPAGVNFKQAWVKVGHVLQGSNYKIVEKDNAEGTYYVIDTAASGGKVKKDMPIYQVHLKASGNGTLISVSPSNPGLQSQLNRSLND